MQLLRLVVVSICALLFGMLISVNSVFAANDPRMVVELPEQDVLGLDMRGVLELAIPVLWKRVVPTKDMEKAGKLKASTSLLLQYKTFRHGVKLTFNPDQVQNYLARNRIQMIVERPVWNLSVKTLGLSDDDNKISQELTDFGHSVVDGLGVHLSPHGKKMALIFAPAIDAYGQSMIHLEMQGAFPITLLPVVDQAAEGFLDYQLQDWLAQILITIRDAYSLGEVARIEQSQELRLTIEGEYTLASQIMLEQALLNHPNVLSLVPMTLQKNRRVYRLGLQGEDETWIADWFADNGLSATEEATSEMAAWVVK
ncbi:MAG: hypothetical protein AUK35_03320 [Zetaproteobacteria bacterium CG2_30_46_52]|nr:MAG: hypothetical protein AUK35_03320 [Zetaproteobacteria bacterium CG2_30_46_52]